MTSQPRNLKDIFEDFIGRRIGLIRALTQDVELFFNLCDPGKERLCLFGLPNEKWEVSEAVEYVPADIPEPVIGINVVRDKMNLDQWLSMVARHSDSWLLSLVFFNGALLDRIQRKHLFNMMNNLPTIFEIVTAKIPIEGSASGSKSQDGTKRSADGKVKSNLNSEDEEEDGHKEDEHNEDEDNEYDHKEDKHNEDEHKEDEHKEDEHIEDVQPKEEDEDEILCGSCGGIDNGGEFWIGCDICEGWFHGNCVMITPGKAMRIKKYKCPSCTIKA